MTLKNICKSLTSPSIKIMMSSVISFYHELSLVQASASLSKLGLQGRGYTYKLCGARIPNELYL